MNSEIKRLIDECFQIVGDIGPLRTSLMGKVSEVNKIYTIIEKKEWELTQKIIEIRALSKVEER